MNIKTLSKYLLKMKKKLRNEKERGNGEKL